MQSSKHGDCLCTWWANWVFIKCCYYKTLPLKSFTDGNSCCPLYSARERHKLLKTGMTKFITQVAQPCRHLAVMTVRWKVVVNVSAFYTTGIFKQVLVNKFLDAVLPVQLCLTCVSYTSIITLLQEKGPNTLSQLKNSDSSISMSGLTHCLLNLNFAGGLPPRPSKIQWTLAAAVVFDEQLNKCCNTTYW